ncbi:cytochrome P450 [Mycena rosella]|uniref:Cytochrome P450 n=1 Tax=Mycena rosella TaxID=1033263 RepID=A0AAD7GRU5_MYCRO|nr:cytochrome P450 [Mycena rosella]
MHASSRVLHPATLASAGVLGLIFLGLLRAKRRAKLPPGPPSVFFFGNLFQLSSRVWLNFTAWKAIYGPVVYLNILGQPIVVLNTAKSAAELLDHRSGIYSDRPQNIVASEIMAGGLLVAFSRYGEVWRRMRRAGHEGLNKNVSPKFHPIQSKEAIFLTHSLMVNPTAWDNHFRRCRAAASVVLSMVYGIPTLLSEQDPKIRLINDFAERLIRAAYPGAFFVEYFTWMRYLPAWMAKWKWDALEQHRMDDKMFRVLFTDVENRAKGGNRESFCATLLEQDRHGLNEKESAWLAATLYTGGAETTSTVLAWFLFVMLSFPDAQNRAQEELDAVVGRSRMPTFADYKNLPYLRALMKETLRWTPVDPISIPHRLIEDDYYEGHLIPKGSIVIANVWALNRDPEVYGPDAHLFNPSRYLDKEGNLTVVGAETKDEGHHSFGFGRRICVGRYVANDSLFIDMASILWGLSIAPLADAPLPSADDCVNNGLVIRPPPLHCSLTPRFADAPGIVANTMELLV